MATTRLLGAFAGLSSPSGRRSPARPRAAPGASNGGGARYAGKRHDESEGARVDIGIIGSGKIGGTAATLFAKAGHQVM
ncbi:MAG TPA: hypothetical protein VK587_13655, partial [bacterium]|nr:hypothetical protein [bacterium]